jgi:hypothetical protein
MPPPQRHRRPRPTQMMRTPPTTPPQCDSSYITMRKVTVIRTAHKPLDNRPRRQPNRGAARFRGSCPNAPEFVTAHRTDHRTLHDQGTRKTRQVTTCSTPADRARRIMLARSTSPHDAATATRGERTFRQYGRANASLRYLTYCKVIGSMTLDGQCDAAGLGPRGDEPWCRNRFG